MKKEIKGIIKKVKEEWGNKYCWRVFWIDVLFIAAVLALSALTNFMLPGLTKASLNALLLFILAYILACIAVYSFFKQKVLGIIMGKKLKQRIWRFCILNMVLFLVVGFATIILYSVIKYFVVGEYMKAFFGIAFFIMMLISYVWINIIQILKMEKKDIEDSLGVIKKNLKRYAYLFLIEFLGLLAIYLIFFILHVTTKGSIALYMIMQIMGLFLLIVFNVFNKFFFVESMKN